MNCAAHTEVEASGFCRNCGKAMCTQCTRNVRGILYCEFCLADMLSRPQPTAGAGSPGLALVLGFIPGAGAAYNGEYTKAIVHVLIFAGLVGMTSSGHAEPFFGILLAAFICYLPIEAYRTARARLLGQAPPAAGDKFWTEKPVGPILLIALGLLFLLGKRFPIWDWADEYWPVIFIVVGALLLWKRMQRQS